MRRQCTQAHLGVYQNKSLGHPPPPRPGAPSPSKALGTRKGEAGGVTHGRYSHPTLESPGLAGRVAGDPWVPMRLGWTCRPGPGLHSIQPRSLGRGSLRPASRPPLPRAGGGRGPHGGPAALTALWPPPRTWPRSSAPSSGRRRRPWSRRRRIPRPQSGPHARRLRRGCRAAPGLGLGFGTGHGTRMAASGPLRASRCTGERRG